MKVGSLFAEIGFKVNESGLEKFSEALKSFQSQISSGLKDLRAYAKAAKEISNAVRETYMPSSKEASARYRAETRRISSQARLQFARAKHFKQDSATRASNAASRAKQIALKESGRSTKSRSSGLRSELGNITRALSLLSPQTLFSSIGMALGGLVSPLGSAIGAHIGKMIDRLIGAVFRAATWLGRTIIAGMRFGMAYRDYRNFTGRSTSSLGGLMARTFNTATMSPEDVLRDASRLETEYWDMILGGGNPAFWQLLGVHPTGNGEIDMQGVLSAIGRVTGGFENRGLARALLKMGGFSEEYLNMMLDAEPGQIDINEMLDRAADWEELNRSFRKFEWDLRKVGAEIAAVFNEELLNKIKEIIIELVGRLPEISELFRYLFITVRQFLDWLRETFPSVFGYTETERERLERKAQKRLSNVGFDLLPFGANEPWSSLKGMFGLASKGLGGGMHDVAKLNDSLVRWGSSKTNNITQNNSFYVQRPEDAEKIATDMARDIPSSSNDSARGIQWQTNDAFSQASTF